MTTNPEVNPSPERCAYPNCDHASIAHGYGNHCRECCGEGRCLHPFTPEPPSQKNDPSTERKMKVCTSMGTPIPEPAAPSTSEKVVESLIEKFVVDTCCGGRDVWHVDESKHRHAGPMKKIGNQRHSTGPNTYMNFYECAACHERAWVGLDAESRIVTRREGEL
jgi:hypothetical protein